VAKNAGAFLRRARHALGFPIEVIAGREEARLIYLGVQHGLPLSKEKRLVVDIGGGSTEFIIGSGFQPAKLASLYMGCVSYSLRFFPDGRITRSAMKQAELAARSELQPIVAGFSSRQWQHAVGSSGTVRALAEIAQANGFGDGALTPTSLERLRASLVRAGHLEHLDLAEVRPDRLPVLPGGLAILSAVLSELQVNEMTVASGALREGLLYDLLGRVHRHDQRDVTVAQFMQRYHVDASQAQRVSALAQSLHRMLAPAAREADDGAAALIGWAAKLHELGISVAYTGYHKHSAYILEKADMPGFSRDGQVQLSRLVLSHRRSLKKIHPLIESTVDWPSVLALRLAALFYRGRTEIALPAMQVRAGDRRFSLHLDVEWLAQNPLTATTLREEVDEWKKIGFELHVPGLEEADTMADVTHVSGG
jgi:exopolyphosphatase / guanosine-5'-triphosphate,3'-diphosphate pyrophosphatase